MIKYDNEENFIIDVDLANKIDGLIYKNIKVRYYNDTNTLIFYDNETGKELDTIIYRNYFPSCVKTYIDNNLITEEDDYYYVVFVLGRDLLKDKTPCENDLAFDYCKEIANDFFKSKYNVTAKGLYECLEDYVNNEYLLKAGILDKIHNEFKEKQVQNEKVLEQLCEKYGTDIDTYYFMQAYGNFEEYLEDLESGCN